MDCVSVNYIRSRAAAYLCIGDNAMVKTQDNYLATMHAECIIIKPIISTIQFEIENLFLNYQNNLISWII